MCVDQQCKKLKGKPDDIKAVKKSVGKLFDRGHIKFVKDLTEDIQSKFINNRYSTGFRRGSCITLVEVNSSQCGHGRFLQDSHKTWRIRREVSEQLSGERTCGVTQLGQTSSQACLGQARRYGRPQSILQLPEAERRLLQPAPLPVEDELGRDG